jgi:hypothetical protein
MCTHSRDYGRPQPLAIRFVEHVDEMLRFLGSLIAPQGCQLVITNIKKYGSSENPEEGKV